MDDDTMEVYRADSECYYVRYCGDWYEVVRGDGMTLIEPEVPVWEYMEAVLYDTEELDPAELPVWAADMLED